MNSTFNISVRTARAIFNDATLKKICKGDGHIKIDSSDGPFIISIEGTEPERTRIVAAKINYKNSGIDALEFQNTISAAGQNIKQILKRLIKGKGIDL